MKRLHRTIFLAILLALVAMPGSAQRPKVGVVLSGGGAKGVTHIGVLKVLEEAGIPIDYISGTSMGAIIGGLYAIGYDPQTLDSLVREQDWPQLLSDRIPRRDLSYSEREMREKYLLTVPLTQQKKLAMPSGFVSGTNVYNLIAGLTLEYKDSIDFKTLPIPFACMAYDIASGRSVKLESGYLTDAIRASMSIPGAFEPVRIDNMLLIDGGIANNYPADVVKDMGADIIIGVDVAMGNKPVDEIKNITDMFTQITWYTGIDSYNTNREITDLYIHPDIHEFTAASFSAEAVDTLLVRGERAARTKWDELIELRRKLESYGYDADTYVRADDRTPIDLERPMHIDDVRFEGLSRFKESTMLRICNIKENASMTPADIQSAVSRLQGISGVSEVTYRLEGTGPHNLVFVIREGSRNFLNLGVRFDSEEMAAILLNASVGVARIPNARFEVTGRLSENPYVRGSVLLGNETDRYTSLSYRFKYNNLDLYEHGDKHSNIDFYQHTASLYTSMLRWRHFNATAGLRFSYYHYNKTLSTDEFDLTVKSDRLITYFAKARYESLDDRYVPRRGMLFNAEYTFYTTNFINNRGHRPFSALDIDFRAAISASKRVAFLPGFFGRVLIGKNIPFPALNMIGGKVEGRYMPQQIAFTGMNHVELTDHAVVGAKFDFRVRLWRKNYVSLKTNYALTAADFWDILDGDDLWGVGLAYSYMTILGPFDLQVDYSNRTKKVGLYVNMGYYF